MENKQTLTSERIDQVLNTLVEGLMDNSIKPGKAKEVNNALGKQISKDQARLHACITLGLSMEIESLGITEEMMGNRILPQSKKQLR